VAAYFLTEDDVLLLREVAREFRTRRPARGGYREGEESGQTPDVYVALTPSGGIAAFRDYSATGTGTGTATATGGDLTNQPGSATCVVYHLELQGLPAATIPELNSVNGGTLTKTVYNLMPVAIPGGMFVLIFRDKFGEWYVPPVPLGFASC
jgi:hypothetical protein